MDQNRTNSWNIALAAVLLLGLLGSGYAISTQMESPASVAPLSAASQEQSAPTAYFPGQYVNQAQHAGEHIQAF